MDIKQTPVTAQFPQSRWQQASKVLVLLLLTSVSAASQAAKWGATNTNAVSEGASHFAVEGGGEDISQAMSSGRCSGNHEEKGNEQKSRKNSRSGPPHHTENAGLRGTQHQRSSSRSQKSDGGASSSTTSARATTTATTRRISKVNQSSPSSPESRPWTGKTSPRPLPCERG